MKMLGRYVQGELLGEGGFARVYLVKDKTNKAEYAAKIMNLPRDSKIASHLRQEVQLLKEFRNPSIVSYIDDFEIDDGASLVLITEYCSKGNLANLINEHAARKKPISEELIQRYLIQVLFGLEYLHSKLVIHRDIKPQNILLMANGDPKIADFGASKILETAKSVAQTSIGTPCYISPEFLETEKATRKADIWSLGCVIYQLCCLELPYSATNEYALCCKIRKDEPKPIPKMYSNELRAIVMRMLTKDPELRWDAKALLETDYVNAYRLSTINISQRTTPGDRDPLSKPAKVEMAYIQTIEAKTNSKGVLARLGKNGKYYCGQRIEGPRCGCCDGYCGPINGCNCDACMMLDIELRKLPQGCLVNNQGRLAQINSTNGYYSCGVDMMGMKCGENGLCAACTGLTRAHQCQRAPAASFSDFKRRENGHLLQQIIHDLELFPGGVWSAQMIQPTKDAQKFYCNNKHELKWDPGNPLTRACDICRRGLIGQWGWWRCKACDYDLCHEHGPPP